MPYTLSHAVISLPVSIVSRGNIPIAAVAVGSMSPDFPYFLALTPTEAPGHSVLGVLIYCLTPSLMILFVWYRWLEKPMFDLLHLPRRPREFRLPFFLFAILGVLAGAYSHVLWDSTSHSYGFFVVNSGFWNQDFFNLPLYKWNQYGSGVFGLLTLLLWYVYAVARNRNEPYKGQFIVGMVVYALGIFSFVLLANIVHGSTTLSEYAVRSAIGVIVGGLFSMCLYAYIVHFRERRSFA